MRKAYYDEHGRLYAIAVEEDWREALRAAIRCSDIFWRETGRHFRLPREGEEDCP